MVGNGDIGVMIAGPPPPMLKSIVVSFPLSTLLIASRSEPSPESFVLLTVYVDGIIRFSRP